MSALRQGLVERLVGRMNLRFPVLFLLLAGLTLFDFLIPDVVPFADELVLALLTAIFGSWKRRRAASDRPRPELERR